MIRFILASASPARLQTLTNAGIDVEVKVSGVDESTPDLTRASDIVTELARRKAQSVFDELPASDDLLVVGCDSLLELDEKTYGKPGSEREALARWQQLKGRTGLLHTGHHVVLRTGNQVSENNRLATTEVCFADLTDDEIASYVATGEPQRVAGGFTVDGYGGPFVSRINGDPHCVVGLSLPLLRQMLLDLGISWPTLWRQR